MGKPGRSRRSRGPFQHRARKGTHMPQSTHRLTSEEEGAVLAHAIALVTARRSGTGDDELGNLAGQIYGELINPDEPVIRSAMRHAWLITALTAMAGRAVDEWEKAAPAAAESWVRAIVKESVNP